MDDDRIHVALTFDDNFWAPAYAVMRSICLSSRRRRDMVFHLCVQDLTDEHRRDLEGIAGEFGATQIFYDLSQNETFNAIRTALRTGRRFPHIAYARLLIDRLIPSGIERILYLDCDTLVLAPIERLYTIDMQGMPVAAVSDPFRMHIMMGRDMRAKAGLFDPAADYFNSGVMLIDVAKYAEVDIPGRVRAFGEEGILQRVYYDQDILNLIFKDRWHKLEWRYNTIDPWRAQQALGPYIVHYTGDNRPWTLVSLVPFHHMYRHIMTNELFYRFMRHRWKRFWLQKLRRLVGRR